MQMYRAPEASLSHTQDFIYIHKGLWKYTKIFTGGFHFLKSYPKLVKVKEMPWTLVTSTVTKQKRLIRQDIQRPFF